MREHNAIALRSLGRAVEAFAVSTSDRGLDRPAEQVGAALIRDCIARALTALGDAPGWRVDADWARPIIRAWTIDPDSPAAWEHWAALQAALRQLPSWLVAEARLYAEPTPGSSVPLDQWHRGEFHGSPWRAQA